MLVDLTDKQSKLIKEALNCFIDNEELWKDRYEDLKLSLGSEKTKELMNIMGNELDGTLKLFENVPNVDETYGYDMGIANIVDPDIYAHIIDDDLER